MYNMFELVRVPRSFIINTYGGGGRMGKEDKTLIVIVEPNDRSI